MKTLKLALILTALVAINASAYQVGTGSSVEVQSVKGTVTQVGQTSDVHQGIEVGIAGNNNSGLAELGTYKTKATTSSTMKGTLNDVTTTQQGFSFFNN
jgi:hypothetical protein